VATKIEGGAAPGFEGKSPGSPKEQPYAYYTLAILTLAGIFNYGDRQILAILAESIRSSLHLTDAHLGFLYGTAFAVLFAVVGVPMGRLTDAMSRTHLMAAGVALWSVMTMVSGLAANFAQLSAARIGVGVGEATANPCSHSLITDYFSRRRRATALSIYLAGSAVGTGGSLILGGQILKHWAGVCGAVGACGVANWQAAFLLVGAPGLIIALLVARLREPQGPPRPPQSLPRLAFREFSATIPPFTLLALGRESGWRGVSINLAMTAAIVAVMALLTYLTGDTSQWIAVGVGAYAVVSFAQILRMRDRPLFELTLGCPTFIISLVGMAGVGIIAVTFNFWAAPHAIRDLGAPASEAGAIMGVLAVGGSLFGAIGGGMLADRWRRHDRRAAIFMTMISLFVQLIAGGVIFLTTDRHLLYPAYLVEMVAGSIWAGAAAALVQELVLPRMRGTGSASFSLIIIILTLALGPYCSGKISAITHSLPTGALSVTVLAPFSLLFLILAARRVARETEPGRLARAQAYGEPTPIS
jgi:MFS family permease